MMMACLKTRADEFLRNREAAASPPGSGGTPIPPLLQRRLHSVPLGASRSREVLLYAVNRPKAPRKTVKARKFSYGVPEGLPQLPICVIRCP